MLEVWPARLLPCTLTVGNALSIPVLPLALQDGLQRKQFIAFLSPNASAGACMQICGCIGTGLGQYAGLSNWSLLSGMLQVHAKY